jgi:hypothetical protein
MKRKLTNTQMQEAVAELTDDMTELKDERQEVKVKQSLASEQFTIIFQALDQAAETIRQTAIQQQRYEKEANKRMTQYEQQSNERLTRLETTVQKLSDMVDRYLGARLNGGSQN